MNTIVRKLLTLSTVAILVASICPAATDDVDKAIATCAAIKGELARLECYDNLAKSRGLQKPRSLPVPTAGRGKWLVTSEVNPIDDSKTVTLVLAADSGVSTMLRTPITLVLRCLSNKTDAYVTWNDYLGSEAMVTSRIGDSPASTEEWSLSTDSQATFYPGNPVAFIRNLLKADRLVAQVTPYNESPVTAIFDLRGLASAVKPLQTTCSWE